MECNKYNRFGTNLTRNADSVLFLKIFGEKNLSQFWSQWCSPGPNYNGVDANWSVVKRTNFCMYFPPAITYVVGHESGWLRGQNCSVFRV